MLKLHNLDMDKLLKTFYILNSIAYFLYSVIAI